MSRASSPARRRVPAALAGLALALALAAPAASPALAAYAVADSGGRVALTDTVHYSGLVAGDAYTATVALVDASTGLALRDAAGSPVTQSVTFVPDAAYGTVSVGLEFDLAVASDGASVTAYESITRDGVEVLRHSVSGEPVTVCFTEPEEEPAEEEPVAQEQAAQPAQEAQADPMPQTGAGPGAAWALGGGLAACAAALACRKARRGGK